MTAASIRSKSTVSRVSRNRDFGPTGALVLMGVAMVSGAGMRGEGVRQSR